MQKKIWIAWSDKERRLFLELYRIHKKHFEQYLEHFPGRSKEQLSAFYYNCKKAKAREVQRKQ